MDQRTAAYEGTRIFALVRVAGDGIVEVNSND